MNAIRQIMTPKNGQIWIDIPSEYRQQHFEVILLPIDKPTEQERLQSKINDFLGTLPAKEPIITDDEIMAEIKAVRVKRYEQ